LKTFVLHFCSFEKLKKRRAERVQAMSREASSLPKEVTVPAEYRHFSIAERLQRSGECSKWLYAYPEKMAGDPESTFWKPVE
jgi:hypothetical protein